MRLCRAQNLLESNCTSFRWTCFFLFEDARLGSTEEQRVRVVQLLLVRQQPKDNHTALHTHIHLAVCNHGCDKFHVNRIRK